MLNVILIWRFLKIAQRCISIIAGHYILYLTRVVHNIQVLALIKAAGSFKRMEHWLVLPVGMDLSLFGEGAGFA